MLNFSFEFDKPSFYDLPPEEKQVDELVLMLLWESSGKRTGIDKYSSREIQRCARQLILSGFLRGSVFGRERCAWSRLTPRGKNLMRLMELEKKY